jgi:Uri superfamily endonuclease
MALTLDCHANRVVDSTPGTYALLLALRTPAELKIGRLGRIQFYSPYYLYFGSAFGPGGLKARIRHHLQPVRRAHWHIDYLRHEADVLGVWYSPDGARLECTWANAALAHRGVSPVPRFGSSDCRCQSHLLAATRLPTLSAFRRRMRNVRPNCMGIRELLAARGPCP